MVDMNFHKFKEALQKVEDNKYQQVEEDVQNVKAFVEKALKLLLDNTASNSRTSYQGLEMY